MAPAAAALLVSTVGASGQTDSKPAKKPDSGKFILTIQGQKAGTSTYKFDAEGGSEASNIVSANGQSMEFTVSVKSSGGKITSVGADAGKANHFTAAIDSGKAKVSINDGAADTQAVPAGAAPFGNFTPHLMHYVVSGYDSKKGGAQTVQMLMIEGLPNGQLVSMPAKVTVKDTADRKIGDKTVAVTTYNLAIEAGGMQIDIKLLADSDLHILAWEVPSQSYTAVREGFEALIKSNK
jgi:hypothetical protein